MCTNFQFIGLNIYCLCISPYKSSEGRIWPHRPSEGQRKPRIIIWANFVGFSPHYCISNFKDIVLLFSKKVQPYMGIAAVLVMWPSFEQTFVTPTNIGSTWNLSWFHRPNSFQGTMFESTILNDLRQRSNNDLDLLYSCFMYSQPFLQRRTVFVA